LGQVKIAAPDKMDLDTIRIYAISKLSWIRKQQAKIKAQKREAPREYLTKESHYYLGKRYLLKVIEHNSAPFVKLKHNTIEMHIRPETDTAKRKEILEDWYRSQLKEMVPKYILKWEKAMKVKVNEFGIKKMKTKWGTCNIKAQRIWLNLELAKKPLGCLEYIVIHEMTHLLERNHNSRFVALMNQFMPNWKEVKEELNRLPVSHTEWGY
jgi:predicted metal-dependent hydrolase